MTHHGQLESTQCRSESYYRCMRIYRKRNTVGDIVFKIGPRINASGRIQNGKEAVELFIEKDFAALEKANKLIQYNETRKDLIRP